LPQLEKESTILVFMFAGDAMGPRAFRPLLAVCPLFLIAPSLCGQVFVVGEKTATADAITEFHSTHVELPQEPLDERGRLDLIRNLEAEQGFAHRQLPLGAGLTLLANGHMIPSDDGYKRMLYQKGASAAPGDRVEITALRFRADSIIIDLNGGPYARHRFLSHVYINNMQIAPLGPVATGCRITLVFEGGVPDVTSAEVKALLDPLVDFTAKSSAEAYTNTLSPKVREAVQTHQILVGMDRQMVIASLGEPRTKHREHLVGEDENSPIYEEWIYGEPPEPTRFVRFREGRVIRLEIAALGKPIEVHDKNEMDSESTRQLLARTIADGDAQPNKGEGSPAAQPPTLRKPGETVDGPATMGRVHFPGDTPSDGTAGSGGGSTSGSATQPAQPPQK
jgi:hypothetical protein